MALDRFHFNVAEDAPGRIPDIRSITLYGEPVRFGSDEAAARFHLSRLFGGDDRPGPRSAFAADRPELVPDLRLSGVEDLRAVSTRLVRFEQVHRRIPVFGSHAVCELTAYRGMLSAAGRVGQVPNYALEPEELTPRDAASVVSDFVGQFVPPTPTEQTYFEHDEKWSLAWLLRDVPAAPWDTEGHDDGHGPGASPRIDYPRFDYLVDAHHGHVLFFYSTVPQAVADGFPPIPVRGNGVGEDGTNETLWGRMEGATYELYDPSRDIITYDLGYADVITVPPAAPFASQGSNLGASVKAVVSAHANATRIFDFLAGVLQRDSIDGLGMRLVNVVNCAYGQSGQTWPAALWLEKRMVYGQAPDATGALASFARFMDIVAHEVTHGITETSCKLVYKDESGALSESMSDILGVIISNWYRHPPEGGSTLAWDWRIGAGLRPGGKPLRDMSDPSVTGHPAQMQHYVVTNRDNGAVHTNSNIHNKAAYNLATAVDADGAPVFTPRELALLYYHALVRLGMLDGFGEALTALVDAATTIYAGDDARRDQGITTIRDAYAAVGIT